MKRALVAAGVAFGAVFVLIVCAWFTLYSMTVPS